MNQKAADIQQEGDKAEQSMNAKHRMELENTRVNKEGEYSTTVKESSELLNLRNMEQHMVKLSR